MRRNFYIHSYRRNLFTYMKCKTNYTLVTGRFKSNFAVTTLERDIYDFADFLIFLSGLLFKSGILRRGRNYLNIF